MMSTMMNDDDIVSSKAALDLIFVVKICLSNIKRQETLITTDSLGSIILIHMWMDWTETEGYVFFCSINMRRKNKNEMNTNTNVLWVE